MNEHDIAARVRSAQNLARQEPGKLGKVEACDPPMGIATDPKLPAFHDVLCDAEQLVRQKPLWAKFVRGTPLENDVPVWIADFALRLLQRDRATRGVRVDAPTDEEIKALAAKHGAVSFRRDQQRNGYMLDDTELIAFSRALLTSGVNALDGGQAK